MIINTFERGENTLMLLSFLVGSAGPIWAEIGAAAIDKALVAGALYAIGKPNEIKKAFREMTSKGNNQQPVVNIFEKDDDK